MNYHPHFTLRCLQGAHDSLGLPMMRLILTRSCRTKGLDDFEVGLDIYSTSNIAASSRWSFLAKGGPHKALGPPGATEVACSFPYGGQECIVLVLRVRILLLQSRSSPARSAKYACRRRWSPNSTHAGVYKMAPPLPFHVTTSYLYISSLLLYPGGVVDEPFPSPGQNQPTGSHDKTRCLARDYYRLKAYICPSASS
jgi:hypothetical protein